MGFFSSSIHQYNNPADQSIPFDKNYIAKVTRKPSLVQEYVNDTFMASFNEPTEKRYVPPTRTLKKTNFSFRALFRRKAQVIHVQSPESIGSNKENMIPLPAVDEVLSKKIEPILSESSIKIHLKQPPEIKIYEDEAHNLEVTLNKEASKEVMLKKRRSFREIFFGSKEVLKEQTPITSPFVSSSVYEAQETLTQRYMNNNYEKLMDDLDAIPFDLTIKEGNSTYRRISKAIQNLSPKRLQSTIDLNEDRFDAVSIQFKSTGQVEKCLETDSWNPYDIAKRIQHMDSISITSSEYELTEKYNVKVGNQRGSRFGTLIRSLSKKVSLRKKAKPIIEDESDNFQNGSIIEMGLETLLTSSSLTIDRDRPQSFVDPFFDTETISLDSKFYSRKNNNYYKNESTANSKKDVNESWEPGLSTSNTKFSKYAPRAQLVLSF